MGLTEGFINIEDETIYPVAPGVSAGQFDSNKYEFRNLSFFEVHEDMSAFWSALRRINPKARLLLTVSPVPLAATASGEHGIVSTHYSKSGLRAVAGELSKTENITYFPSFEIISSHPSKANF